MARRMIDTGMWSNENFAALPAMGRLLLIGIITLADDQGRCKANPAYLRSQIFPYEDIATGDIDCWLDQMADNGTVILYSHASKAYLQLTNWWEYQPLDWARPSDYPPPQGWRDRVRFNAKGGVHLTHNWRTKAGVPTPDSCDATGNPIAPSTPNLSDSVSDVPTQVPTQVPTEVGTPTNKTNLNKTKVSESTGAEGVPPSPQHRTRGDYTQQQSAKHMRREYPKVDPKLLTTLTNEVKRIYGFTALIDKPGTDDLEDKMRDEAYRLWDLGFDTQIKMAALNSAWRERASSFRDKRPYGDQLYQEAVQLISNQDAATDADTLPYSLGELA